MNAGATSPTLTTMTRAMVLAAAFLTACAAPVAPLSQGTSTGQDVELFYASYQMNAEPHYRLIFEGGSDVVRPSEVRILTSSGAVVAAAPTVPVPSDNEPIRLCGPTKTSVARLYGPLRATVALPQQMFKDFISEPTAFRVEAKIADAWRSTRLTNLCHAQE